MLDHWGVDAELKNGSMTKIPYKDHHFNVIADIFSSYCLPQADFIIFLDEVARTTISGGLFFSYTPSTN